MRQVTVSYRGPVSEEKDAVIVAEALRLGEIELPLTPEWTPTIPLRIGAT